MSYQTRKQSIGYLLKGAMKTEIPSNKLVDIASTSSKIVDPRNDITNNETLNYADLVANILELGSNIKKQFRNEVYLAFDMNTVEEAEDYYETFANIFYFLRE